MYKIINLFYPSKCPKCDNTLPYGKIGFCDECINEVHPIRYPYCSKCGRPVKLLEDLCDKCKGVRNHQFIAGRILYPYAEINDAVYKFKYMNRPEFAKAFAKYMYDELSDWLNVISPDAFIPVPLHKKRLIERGYNQSEELSKELTKLTNIPTESKVVFRVKNTLPQKQFDRTGRYQNVKNAFIVKESVVKLSTVVLIDDIFTTGSTVDTIAEVLHEANVKEVYFIALAAAGVEVQSLV